MGRPLYLESATVCNTLPFMSKNCAYPEATRYMTRYHAFASDSAIYIYVIHNEHIQPMRNIPRRHMHSIAMLCRSGIRLYLCDDDITVRVIVELSTDKRIMLCEPGRQFAADEHVIVIRAGAVMDTTDAFTLCIPGKHSIVYNRPASGRVTSRHHYTNSTNVAGGYSTIYLVEYPTRCMEWLSLIIGFGKCGFYHIPLMIINAICECWCVRRR